MKKGREKTIKGYQIGITLPIYLVEKMEQSAGRTPKAARDNNFTAVLTSVLTNFTPPNVPIGVSFSRAQIGRRYPNLARKMFFFNVPTALHSQKSETLTKNAHIQGIHTYFNECLFLELMERFQ